MDRNYRLILLCAFCTVWCGTFLAFVDAQFGARNTVPETISSCYINTTAYNRYTRQPMSMQNLIAIIRKIERKDPQWDMRRIARTLINRYMFDGIEFNPSARPEFQFSSKSTEAIKTHIIKSMIPIQIEEMLPPGVLDNDELCALHWSLSTSLNATVRDEELGLYPFSGTNNGYNPNTNTGYNNNGGTGGYNPNSGNSYSGQRRGRREVENATSDEETEAGLSDEEENGEENISLAKSEEKVESVEAEKEKSGEEEEESVDNADDNGEEPQVPTLLGRSAPGLGLQSDADKDGATKFARQVSQLEPGKTRRPIETGVVYTKWGSVSAARVIAGIAAALQPMAVSTGSGSPYPNSGSGYYGSGTSNQGNTGNYPGFGSNSPFPGSNTNNNNNNNNPFNSGSNPNSNYPGYQPSKNTYGRRKRQVSPITFQPLQNIHAATLAGDVGQAAILNGKYQLTNVAPPRGVWNDTICPREYVLEPYPYADKEIYMDDATLTFASQAEIRGGMDGLILGHEIVRWDNARMRLSEVLEMYYSETGIVGEPQFRSCNRGALFTSYVDMAVVREQSRSFAYLFNNASLTISPQTIAENPTAFINSIDETYQKMSGVASTVGSSDPQCTRRQSTSSSALDTDDSLKFTEIKNRIYAVLDHTATYDEINAEKRFFAQLAHEIDVSPRGSRLGIVDGNSGQLLISPNHTDNSAILACNILSLPTQIKTQDIVRVLNSLRSELERLRAEEERLNYESDLGVVFMFLIQGRKLDEGQKTEIRKLLQDFENNFGDVKIIFTSSKYQQGDFEGFLINPSRDFIKIQSVQNISDFADEFTTEMRSKSHAKLGYTKCNVNRFSQDEEHKVETTFFVTPDTIQYFKIAPDYFHSSKNLRLRFTSDKGKVRICQGRNEGFPNSRNQGSNGVSCKETSGSYITPGNSQTDVEFTYSKPCGKHGDRNGCTPIYISVTPTQYPNAGETGWDCAQDGCQFPNQVKVTFTHWDMRCNGAVKNLFSLPMALMTLTLSIIFWNKSS